MLKLAKLPDRTPVRLILNVSPDLNRALTAYAEAYRQTAIAAEIAAEARHCYAFAPTVALMRAARAREAARKARGGCQIQP